MTNREIRARAKEMRERAKGLVPISFAVAALGVAPQLLIWWTPANPHAKAFLNALIMVVIGLISGAGVAFAGCAAWRTGRARFSDLFAPLTDARRFARAMAVVLAAVALSLAQRYVMGLETPDAGDALPILFGRLACLLAILVVAVPISALYYAVALWSDAGIGTIFGRGFKLGLRAYWRFVGMDFVALFLPSMAIIILALILAVVARMAAPSLFAVILLALALTGTVALVVWRVMPYYYLASAGLAIDIFGEDGTKMEETK